METFLPGGSRETQEPLEVNKYHMSGKAELSKNLKPPPQLYSNREQLLGWVGAGDREGAGLTR